MTAWCYASPDYDPDINAIAVCHYLITYAEVGE